MSTVSVIGVGRIGAALLPRLVAAGHTVVAFDIDVSRRGIVDQAGAQWAADVANALSNFDFVLTVLPGTPEIAELALSSDQFLPRMRRGTTWIDLTSASYPISLRCADAAAEHAVAYVGAPIGGGAEAVANGSAIAFVGGDTPAVETALSILGTFTRMVHHAGGPGQGNLAKLLVNLLWFGQVGLVTESFLLAQRLGLPPGVLRPMLRHSAADSTFIETFLPDLLAGDYLASFGLDRCVEELEAVEASAEQAGTPRSLISAIAELHRSALAHFGPLDGEMLAAAWLEEQAGSRLADG